MIPDPARSGGILDRAEVPVLDRRGDFGEGGIEEKLDSRSRSGDIETPGGEVENRTVFPTGFGNGNGGDAGIDETAGRGSGMLAALILRPAGFEPFEDSGRVERPTEVAPAGHIHRDRRVHRPHVGLDLLILHVVAHLGPSHHAHGRDNGHRSHREENLNEAESRARGRAGTMRRELHCKSNKKYNLDKSERKEFKRILIILK